MSSFKVMAVLAVVMVLLPMTALGDFDDFAPGYPPFSEKVCDMVDCGKGTCKANASYPLNYICECQPGWKRTRVDDDYDHDDHDDFHDIDDDYMFLPCIIPNCTLNYGTCQPAPPPVPDRDFPRNISAFDPCNWIYCGEGTCKRNSTYKHTCECNSGFSNLLGIPYYPCYSNCTLGSDCATLGISVSNEQTSTNTTTDGGSQATSFLPGKFHWMTILMAVIAMALWK